MSGIVGSLTSLKPVFEVQGFQVHTALHPSKNFPAHFLELPVFDTRGIDCFGLSLDRVLSD